MPTQDTETLAQLVRDHAGGEGKLTFVQLSERSIDPTSGYRPSANLLHRIASDVDVKINPRLVRAIAAGLGMPLPRVQAAAARQFIGWEVDDPFGTEAGEDDEVVRVAHRPGATSVDMPRAEEELRKARRAGRKD